VLCPPGAIQMPIDLLAKKPFRLSREAGFMIGLGPELATSVASRAAVLATNSIVRGTRYAARR